MFCSSLSADCTFFSLVFFRKNLSLSFLGMKYERTMFVTYIAKLLEGDQIEDSLWPALKRLSTSPASISGGARLRWLAFTIGEAGIDVPRGPT